MNLISQIASDNAAVLFAYGPMGVVLAWFMWRAERTFVMLADLAHRVDGLTKALLVDMVHRESSGLATKRYAVDAIAKIDARAANDKQK